MKSSNQVFHGAKSCKNFLKDERNASFALLLEELFL